MGRRLQIIIDDGALREVRRLAEREQVTPAEWVRSAIRDRMRRLSGPARDRKLGVIRAATEHGFPTADIDEMLAEIGRCYVAHGQRE